MRDSLVLTSLIVVAACPPADSTTTDDPATTTGATTDDPTTSGTTVGPGETSTGPGDTSTGPDDPTTGSTTDATTGSTTDAITGSTTDATTGSTTDATTDTTTDTTGDPPPPVETCAELHEQDPSAGDGEYTLYVGKDPDKPWTVYCHDMAGTPTDYLPLVNVEDGRNFSQYTTSGPGTTVHTQFTRVRIDPKTLVVDIDDVTFSESTGSLMHGPDLITSMPYAVAEGCDGSDIADGLANVDLVGTPFKVIDPFCTKGAGADGEAVFSSDDQVVDLTGGGFCGWTGPTKDAMCVFDPQKKNSGFVLELEYIGAQPANPETCADIKAQDPAADDGEYTLYVGGDEARPWTAYCHDMAGEPKDYLVLVNLEDGRNFSQYTTTNPQYTNVRTAYTRVRIDPKTLVVEIDDRTFSSSTGMLMHGAGLITSMPYAVAEGCAGSDVANGVGNIDLVGTPFAVDDPFCTAGFNSAGEVVKSSDDQIVDLTGGGSCGWSGPKKGNGCVSNPQDMSMPSGFVLELKYIGVQPLTPETCADVKAQDPGADDGEYTLYVGGDEAKPWTAYCHDMAGEPKDYLVLVNVEEGHNFSQYTASDPQFTDVVTAYTRVRIDPKALVVDIDDRTFSSSTGMLMHGAGLITSMPYAIAMGCAGGGVDDGLANIDLVGTPFAVIDPFCTGGAAAAGGAVKSASDQIVDVTGGGSCGWAGPTKDSGCVAHPQDTSIMNGFVLELEYIGV